VRRLRLGGDRPRGVREPRVVEDRAGFVKKGQFLKASLTFSPAFFRSALL
jgi:hypothetical protein